ncbi:aspartic peptidase domain-containing protein [Mycena galericulata]|nr:aspartic peptidase domain-containing protein [Mycena galericulata]
MFALPFFLFFSPLAICNARTAKRSAPPLETLVIPVQVAIRVEAFLRGFRIVSVFPRLHASARYNPSASSTVQQLPQSQDFSTLNGTASGTLVRENCDLIQSNGSAWSYPNQTVTVVNQSSSFFSSGASGMVGMGLAPFEDSPAANWLARNPAQPTFSYGMALNPPSNLSGDGGGTALAPTRSVILRGGHPVEDDAGRKRVNAVKHVQLSDVELLTFLDPFYASIVFPQGAARSIYADIPGTSKHATSAFSHSWKLPCDSKFTLTVTFGSFSTSLDQSSLVVKQADGLCVGTIQEWIDQNATEYLLGSPFIAVLYLFSQSGDGSMGVAVRARGSNKLSPAAIAGVVLGTFAVVALLVIAGVLVYFAWQRRSKTPRIRKHRKTDITPFPSDISESRDCVQTTSSQDHRLLNGASSPASPDWRTTLLTTDTNTPRGTTFSETPSSPAYYRTEMHSSASLINLDSPPPYAVPHRDSPPPVPLIPLRKNRELFNP